MWNIVKRDLKNEGLDLFGRKVFSGLLIWRRYVILCCIEVGVRVLRGNLRKWRKELNSWMIIGKFLKFLWVLWSLEWYGCELLVVM